MANRFISLLILMAIASNAQAQETDYELMGSYNATGYVLSVSVSSNGSSIANSPDNIYFFNREGKPYWILSKTEGLKKAAVSSDGSHIIVISEGKIFFFDRNGMFLWESRGEPSARETGTINRGIFNSIWINHDGSYTGAGTEQVFYLFDSREKNIVFKKNNIVSYSVSSDGSLIATGYANKIYLDNKWGTALYDYTTDSDVRIVLMSSNGSIISAITGKSIYFLNPTYYKNNAKNNISNINTASISSDGSYVTAGSGNTIYLLYKNGTLLWDYDTNHSIADVKISSDGSRIAAGAGRNIYIFNREGTLLWSYKTGKDVLSVSISSNGSYVAAGSKDNKVYFIGEKKPLSSLPSAPTIQIFSGTNTSNFTSVQTPEPVQNKTPQTRSTPFLSAIYATAMLVAGWMMIGISRK